MFQLIFNYQLPFTKLPISACMFGASLCLEASSLLAPVIRVVSRDPFDQIEAARSVEWIGQRDYDVLNGGLLAQPANKTSCIVHDYFNIHLLVVPYSLSLRGMFGVCNCFRFFVEIKNIITFKLVWHSLTHTRTIKCFVGKNSH